LDRLFSRDPEKEKERLITAIQEALGLSVHACDKFGMVAVQRVVGRASHDLTGCFSRRKPVLATEASGDDLHPHVILEALI
jgi:hypothetical protein